jgi:hypothetical protein
MTLFTRILLTVVVGASWAAATAQQTSPPQADPSAQLSANSSPTTTPSTSPSTTPSPAPAKPQQQQTSQDQPLTSAQVLKQEEKQRALGIVPMFGMTSVKNAPPLTSKQKFQLMGRTMYDPFFFVSAGLTAGLGQANNSFPQYGQGASGFGKRYGAALADNADSNLFSNFVYPVLFKQDPRYFRVGEGSFKRRLGTALEEEFVARKDSGGKTFHYSNVLGAITAGTISNVYYPSESRGVGLTAGRAATALAYGCLGNIFLEFWPDVEQKLFHKQQSQAHPGEPPGVSPR